MKSLVKFVTTMLIILTLMGSTTAAFAQENQPEPNRPGGLRGEVAAVGDSSLTVTPPDGQNVTVHVSDETRIRLAESQSQGNLEDIEPGNFVGVRGPKNDDGSINARFILVLPQNPRDLARTHGKVTAIDGAIITIENRDGESQEITTDDQTRIRIGKEKGTLEDIEVGDPLAAAGVKKDDGTFVARLIIIATGDQIRKHTLRGEVLEVNLDDETLTVQGKGDEEKVWLVKTTDATQYRVPGVDEAGLDDIEVGNHVLIAGQKDQDSENSGVARVIAVIPAGGRDGLRLRGEVTAVDESNQTFRLDTRRGEFIILTDGSTRYLTRGDEEVSFDDIGVGSKVLVAGQKVEDQDNTVLAKLVGLKPNPEGGNSN